MFIAAGKAASRKPVIYSGSMMALRPATIIITISLSSIAAADITGSAMAYKCSNNEVHGVCTAAKESTDPYTEFYLERCRLVGNGDDEVDDITYSISGPNHWSGNWVAVLPAVCNLGYSVSLRSEFRYGLGGSGPPDPVTVNRNGVHMHSCGCPTC